MVRQMGQVEYASHNWTTNIQGVTSDYLPIANWVASVFARTEARIRNGRAEQKVVAIFSLEALLPMALTLIMEHTAQNRKKKVYPEEPYVPFLTAPPFTYVRGGLAIPLPQSHTAPTFLSHLSKN
jgi:hypothetical protein